MELNREISRFNRCWMTGVLIGPLIGGALYHLSSLLNFIAISAGFSAVFLLLMLLRRHIRITGEDKAEDEGAAARPGAGVTAKPSVRKPAASPENAVNALQEKALSRYRLRGWIGVLCSSLFMGVLINVVPLHIRDGLGYTEQAAGQVLFFRGISALIGFTLFARFTFWHFNRRWFIFTQSVLILCTVLFLIAGSHLYIYIFIIFLYGFCHSAAYNNSIFHASAGGKNAKKNLALHEIFLSIGSAAGAAGGGFCYQHFGFFGTYLILTLVQTGGLVFFILQDRRAADGSPRVRRSR
jgi:predicted MFS family arabinose efflux permease